MYKYQIIIDWSEIDLLFVGQVPELLGCMAHGETQETALTNIKEAMELWIDTAKEFGDPIPEPQVSKIAIWILLIISKLK